MFVLTDIERDGDELECAWFYHPEPGTFTTSSGTSGKPLTIMDADKQRASFFVPAGRVLRSGTKHIILGATDRGSPPLTRCKRVILDVEE